MTAPVRLALVTGAAEGIGRAVARQLLESGASVVAIDRQAIDPASFGDAAERVVPVKFDLADRAGVPDLVKRLKPHGRFDRIVLNAGINATGRFEDIPDDAYRRLIDVNLAAPLLMTGALLREDLLAHDARLIFVSSLSHRTGYPGASAYAASKDALAVYPKSMRPTLEKRGIAVTTAFPGPARTGHAARHAPKGGKEAARMAPDKLARLILAAAERRQTNVYPGLGAKFAGLAGRIAPGPVTRMMRRLLLDRMDGPVW